MIEERVNKLWLTNPTESYIITGSLVMLRKLKKLMKWRFETLI